MKPVGGKNRQRPTSLTAPKCWSRTPPDRGLVCGFGQSRKSNGGKTAVSSLKKGMKGPERAEIGNNSACGLDQPGEIVMDPKRRKVLAEDACCRMCRVLKAVRLSERAPLWHQLGWSMASAEFCMHQARQYVLDRQPVSTNRLAANAAVPEELAD